MISRRFVLGGLLAGVAGGAFANPPETSLRPRPRPALPGGLPARSVASADGMIQTARLGGTLGFLVADATTGTVLEAHDPDRPQPPASVAKALTALYALDRLGRHYRFGTRVLATGPIVQGTVQGDIVLVGSGDPTLQTDQLGDLAALVAAAGVRGLTGRFLACDGALPRLAAVAADQPDHVGYNPAISGLNLNFNRVHFEWKRAGAGGWGLTMDARGARFVPPVRMTRMAVVDRDTPVFTHALSDLAEDWTVAAAALGKGGSRWLPVRLPALYTAEVFQTLARAQGIELPAPVVVPVPPEGQQIARLQSPVLPEVLRDMLRFSTNITAEVVGLAASGAADLPASATAMNAWAQTRLGIRARLVDHSGLGGGSRISAADMAGALIAARAQGSALTPILRDLGMRNDKGEAVEGHPVRVLAKTGTLNFVSGLAGHIVPPGGREMVFAIFAADVPRRETLSLAEREQPPGGPEWARRARTLQGRLIARWTELYA